MIREWIIMLSVIAAISLLPAWFVGFAALAALGGIAGWHLGNKIVRALRRAPRTKNEEVFASKKQIEAAQKNYLILRAKQHLQQPHLRVFKGGKQ